VQLREVTKETARKMGELCEILKQRGTKALAAQRFVLQCVLAMFAEDRGMLPSDMFINCIQDCLGGKSSYDVLSGLFQEMNRPGISPAGQYKGVDYFFCFSSKMGCSQHYSNSAKFTYFGKRKKIYQTYLCWTRVLSRSLCARISRN
jgi:hypothetical protein